MRQVTLVPPRMGLLGLLCALASGCALAPGSPAGKVYHCVEAAIPVVPAEVRHRQYVAESFVYGEHRVDETTPAQAVFGRGRCGPLAVPDKAYLRYRVDTRLVEKHFDLSSLSAERVHNKTVAFYVQGDRAEVRLISPGTARPMELIDRR